MFDNYFENEPLIVSTGKGVTVREIIELIVKNLKFEGKVKWITDNRFNKKDIKIFNNNKMKKLNSNINFTSIEIGIKKTIEWWLKNER